MRTSTWVMLIGAGIAVVDQLESSGSSLIPASIAGTYNANTGVGSGLSGILDPIDNALPFVQNVGLWIVAAGAIMRFGFGK